MKGHLFLGVGILAGILALGLMLNCCLDKAAKEAEMNLLNACEAANRGDLVAANRQAELARQSWNQVRHLAACLIEHQDLEAIELDFGALEVRFRQHNREESAILCQSLAQRIRALADNEKPVYDNILTVLSF